ncbi:MAG: hypothetical protein WC216_10545 [Gallionella sp.]|jgi:hypothetical protein
MNKLTTEQAQELMSGESIKLIEAGNYHYKNFIVSVEGYTDSTANLLILTNRNSDETEAYYELSDSEVIAAQKVILNPASYSRLSHADKERQKVILEHFNLTA